MIDILKELGIEPTVIIDSELGLIDLSNIDDNELVKRIDSVATELDIKLEP
jgi:hypothetical protein